MNDVVESVELPIKIRIMYMPLGSASVKYTTFQEDLSLDCAKQIAKEMVVNGEAESASVWITSNPACYRRIAGTA